MTFSRVFASILLPASLAACAALPGQELDELLRTTPTGTPFAQALTREYSALAQAERDQADWGNSERFARKGLASAKGTAVPPEDPADWAVAGEDSAKELADAHARLTALLATNAPHRAPVLTATAQVKFDCWLGHLGKGASRDHMAICRKDFLAAVKAIEVQVVPTSGGHP
jgi:OOP family OmpA-OmpF porin